MLFLSTILLFTLGAMICREIQIQRRFEMKRLRLKLKTINALNDVRKQRGR